MSQNPAWWRKPRNISVVVDNPSWIIPMAEGLVDRLNRQGDIAVFCRDHGSVTRGAVAIYLGCIKIAPPEVLALNRRNVVVHESDLPRGRGFSPLTWQILEGMSEIPVCLFEAADEADAGPIIYRDRLSFEGHELIDEMRLALGRKTMELCQRFLAEPTPPSGVPQAGKPSYYPRRWPRDSRLDPDDSLVSQFNMLRVVDNERYPAFFTVAGHTYGLRIEKLGEEPS